ncbi:MAG: gamma-glutamyltransferase, partial [Marinomonas sp.]
MRDFQQPGRSAVMTTNGMCATSHPIAAQAAIDILKRGGTAMDAAIAGAVLLGICEPQSTGIGGDCFALVSPAGTDDVLAFNGSGRAPAGANAAALRDKGETTVPLYTADAVTVPGAVDMFCNLSERFGTIGLDACLAPAIHYAEEGVPVAPRVAFDWALRQNVLQGAARRFYLRDNAAIPVHGMFRAPGQAEVLRRVARDGRDAFYTGEIAEDMLATLHSLGGVHSAQDFAEAHGQQT